MYFSFGFFHVVPGIYIVKLLITKFSFILFCLILCCKKLESIEKFIVIVVNFFLCISISTILKCVSLANNIHREKNIIN